MISRNYLACQHDQQKAVCNNNTIRLYDRNTTAAGVPGGRWGSVVFGWRALRPPRVVFVLGFVSNKFSHFRQELFTNYIY